MCIRDSYKAVGAGSGGGVKPNNKSPKLVPRVYHQRSLNQGEPPQAGQKSEVVNPGSMIVTPESAPVRRCFLCNSPGHLVVNCPKRTGGKQAKFGSSPT